MSIKKNYWKEISKGEYEIKLETGDKRINFKLKSLKNPLVYYNTRDAFYYQQTRLSVTGSLSFAEKNYEITGFGWIDHQGFKSMMPWKSWRWYNLQLSNNTEIVFSSHLVSHTGEFSEKSSMIIFKDDDKKEILKDREYQIDDLEYWTDPGTNIRYPIKWHLTVPSSKADLVIEALIPDQTVNGSRIYEGTCLVSGVFDGQTVIGRSQFEYVP